MKNKVVGVRFKEAGKKYYFDPKDYDLEVGEHVVVETVRGLEIGEVMEETKVIEEEALIASLKPILRRAENSDIQHQQENENAIPEVLTTTQKLIHKHDLGMKLLDAEYTLDQSKLIIYFNAEGRIDFRELVKDLANTFRVRIELRQVGARDGAKFLGGIGPCGYLLCCNTFLGEFETVSIKMAKNQNLSLNPTNISGLCGKLLCCIRYEDDTYSEMRVGLPKQYSKVKTTEGIGRVTNVNILERTVKVQLEETIKDFNVEDLLEIYEYDPLEFVNGDKKNALTRDH